MSDFSTGRGTIQARTASGSQHRCRLENVLRVDADFHHVPKCRIHIVFHSAKLNLSVLNDRIGTTPVPVARLPDAPGIENLNPVDLGKKLQMGVADADDVGFDSPQTRLPRGGLLRQQVFIHRVVRGGMDEIVVSAVEIESLRDRKPRKVLQMKTIQKFKLKGTGGRGERAESGSVSGGNALSDGVVVVSPNGAGCVLTDPFDAGERIGPVIDHIPQEQAGIERFLDRGKRRPVGMDIGEDKNFHIVNRRER